MMTIRLYGIEACVFDAYGTLFDVNSAACAAQDSLREKWQRNCDAGSSAHQNYAKLHPNDTYIAINDAPKVEHLRQQFPDLYRK
jgi:FMN phosphatase YigB (HAD superfamily)